MTSIALNFLRETLNNFIFLKDPLKSAGIPVNLVILDNLMSQENKPLHTGGDFILMSLINIEEETVGKSQLPYHKTADDKLAILNPDIKLNLYLQFAAFSDTLGKADPPYTRALKLLDQVVLCFQYRNVFTSAQYPALLQGGVNKIVMEHVSLTFEQLNHLWATLGAKYQPSIVYKCKTLTFLEAPFAHEHPLIKEISTTETLS